MPTKSKKMTKKTNYLRKRRQRRYKGGWQDKSIAWYATRAWQGVRMLKGLVNVEKKWLDTSFTLNPGTAGTIGCLNILAQGSSDITRNGDSILMKSLQLKIGSYINPAAAQDLVRIVLVMDKENRGAVPAITDVLESAGLQAFINKENTDRFVILRDMYISLATNGAMTEERSEFEKLDVHAKYSGAAGDITDVRQNSLFLITIATENTSKSTINVGARIAFYDN